ncbi:MAG TPA: hypothetical protein VGM88_16985 [Kofleriaceae bacterium]
MIPTVGFWFDERAPSRYPRPQRLLGGDRALLDYLRSGTTFERYPAASPCRFGCGRVGRRDLTDGAFVWPEGLAHYVEEHGVRLPPWFVPGRRARSGFLDDGPWIRWARAEGACVDLRGWRVVEPAQGDKLVAELRITHPHAPKRIACVLGAPKPRTGVFRLPDARLAVVRLRAGGPVRLTDWDHFVALSRSFSSAENESSTSFL